MQDGTTTPNETTHEDAPEIMPAIATTTDNPVAETNEDATIETILAGGIGDDTRVENVAAFVEQTTTVQRLLTNFRRTAATLRGQSGEVANVALGMAALVARPNGFPDWARSSDAYKKSWGLVWSRVYETADDDLVKSSEQTIRKAVERLRPFYIAGFVLDHEEAFAELRTQAEQSSADRETILKTPPAALKARVLDHLRSQVSADGKRLLSDPKDGPYKPEGSPGREPAGPGPNPQRTANEIVTTAGEASAQLSAKMGAAHTLSSLLGIVSKVTTGDVEDRPEVRAIVQTVQSLAYALVRSLDGQFAEGDTEALAEMVAEASKLLRSVKP